MPAENSQIFDGGVSRDVIYVRMIRLVARQSSAVHENRVAVVSAMIMAWRWQGRCLRNYRKLMIVWVSFQYKATH